MPSRRTFSPEPDEERSYNSVMNTIAARAATVERNTKETQITVAINLDGTGKADLQTGVPFLDHMLDQLARHGMMDVTVHARGDLHIDAHHTVEDIGITLGQAVAKALGDKDVLEVAKPWLPMAEAVEAKSIREQLLRRLATPPLLALPEKSPPRVISGFTVRRPAPKVGRNDPCPCGSGKKYKKCCAEKDAERAWDPSPMPGLTRSEYLRSAGSELTSREVDLLRIQELAELNFPSLSTLPLIAALRRALIFHRLDLAESAMEALSTRTDFPGGGDADGYRAELIHVAVETDNLEFAKRHLDLLHDRKEAFQSDLITIELRSPSEQTLARLEQTALSGLQEPKGNALFDLSFALLRGSPALGILVARASLSAASFATEPQFVRKTVSRSPGAIVARLCASAVEYCDMNAMQISWRCSSWNRLRASRMRGWLCPHATEPNPPKKSRIARSF